MKENIKKDLNPKEKNIIITEEQNLMAHIKMSIIIKEKNIIMIHN